MDWARDRTCSSWRGAAEGGHRRQWPRWWRSWWRRDGRHRCWVSGGGWATVSGRGGCPRARAARRGRCRTTGRGRRRWAGGWGWIGGCSWEPWATTSKRGARGADVTPGEVKQTRHCFLFDDTLVRDPAHGPPRRVATVCLPICRRCQSLAPRIYPVHVIMPRCH